MKKTRGNTNQLLIIIYIKVYPCITVYIYIGGDSTVIFRACGLIVSATITLLLSIKILASLHFGCSSPWNYL